MRDGKNGYAASLGLKRLLVAIRPRASRRNPNVQSVFVTQASANRRSLPDRLLNPAKNVLSALPDYPLYSAVWPARNSAESLRPQRRRRLAARRQRIRKKITLRHAVSTHQSHNPTGALYSRRNWKRCGVGAEHNWSSSPTRFRQVILDDGEEHVAVASIAPDVPASLSAASRKIISAPGWRIGWAS